MTLQHSEEDTYQGQTLDIDYDDTHLDDKLDEVSLDGHPANLSNEGSLHHTMVENEPPEVLVTLPKKTSEEEQLPNQELLSQS